MTLQASVAKWNERHKANDPPEECPRCHQPRCVSIEMTGNLTTAACNCCGFWWVIV